MFLVAIENFILVVNHHGLVIVIAKASAIRTVTSSPDFTLVILTVAPTLSCFVLLCVGV